MLKTPVSPPGLILASSSRYRGELLLRLRLAFIAEAPEVDETPRPGEDAAALSARLPVAKARALGARFPDHWVLGSDQAADCNGVILGKPGTHAAAVAQLQASSGRSVRFHTGVALCRGETLLQAQDLTTVHFRALSLDEIERYLKAEPAYDCAGSFRCEGLGISLFERLETADPTALVGLPLIATARLLRQAGFRLP